MRSRLTIFGRTASTPAERRIVEKWERHRLDSLEYEPGEALAFLKQLERLLE